MIYPLDDVVARGHLVVLRRKRTADIPDDYAWRRDPELARLDAATPTRMDLGEYARNWHFDMQFTDVPGRYFAIEDESGRRIGNIMYYNLDYQRREAEIGISIGVRAAWGQGYGSDAMLTAARHLFGSLGLRRLYLRTLDWNEHAQRAFQKAGFRAFGTAFREGHTFVLMELRSEWLAS